MTIHHGIKSLEPTTAARAIATASSEVVGIVVVAEDADEDAFPLDTAVLITNVRQAIGKAGTTGTLAKTLNAISDQCSPLIVVVRVAEGEDDEETEANIIGTTLENGKLTGMKALLTAQTSLGSRPTILGIPYYDSQAVTTALAIIAKKLDGMVYAKAVGDTKAEAIAYKVSFAARELELIWPDWSDWEGSAVARALGLRALLDQTIGFHQSLSNQPVQGVTGISKDVYWDLSGDGTDAAALNNAQVTTLIRTNGFRYWGNRTCSALPEFAFEVAVRTGSVIRRTIAEGIAQFSDRPMTAQLVKDIIDTINAKFRALKTAGKIMGASCWYDPDLNDATDLSSGSWVLDYDYTPVAPMEDLTLNQRITSRYYNGFGDELAKLTS